MKTTRLGSIAESLPCDYGGDPTDDAPAFDVVKVSNVSAQGQFHGNFEKRRFREDQLVNLLVQEGELLVVKSSGSKANILSGKTAICGADRAGRVVASNFLLRLRVDESVAVPRFLWYVLNSDASKAFVKTIVGASTYPNLKWSSYAAHPIPLPPLPEQRRIAEILDKADALRAKRRAVLSQLDTLTQSIFLDMFGDPATNPKGWPRMALEEVFDVARGGSPRPIDDFVTDNPDGINWIMIGDASEGSKYITRTKKRIRPEGAQRSRTVKPSDFLLTNSMSFGRPYIMRTSGCIHDGWLVLSPRKTDVDPDYFYTLLGSRAVFAEFSRRAPGATVKNLNIELVRGVTIPVAPYRAQKEYARAVAVAERAKEPLEHAHAQLDALFASLQHSAFRGEL